MVTVKKYCLIRYVSFYVRLSQVVNVANQYVPGWVNGYLHMVFLIGNRCI